MALGASQGDVNVSTPAKRIRWATQRVTSVSARRKKNGVMNRFHKNSTASEKKRESGTSDSSNGSHKGSSDVPDDESANGDGRRRIFFNRPLPSDARDEEGHPLAQFGRNKIRTARYTPLSFVPKNLYYQFHNIANIYFLIMVILGVRIWVVRFP